MHFMLYPLRGYRKRLVAWNGLNEKTISKIESWKSRRVTVLKFYSFPPLLFQKVVLKQKNNVFTLLCGASKGFMKAFKAFIKPFEAPQRNVKIKIKLFFSLRPRSKRERLRKEIKSYFL